MNTTARANNAADTTDEDAFADVNTQKNAVSSSESSLSSSLRESLAKELSVLLSKVHLGLLLSLRRRVSKRAKTGWKKHS